MKTIQKKMIQTSLLALGLTLFTACSSGGSKAADTNTTQPEPISITHNGTTYGFVTSPDTGKVWLDRNLGAAETCASFDDAACYGDYYQWGRDFDGHQDSTSGMTNTQATNVTDVGHGDFITSNSVNSYDWAKDIDINGITRQTNWSNTDGSSVCPVGFRVPDIEELRAETIDASIKVTNNATAFTNFLKLPSAGGRDYLDASLQDQDGTISVWASSADGSRGHGIFFSGSDDEAGVLFAFRARGYSVRCLKD